MAQSHLPRPLIPGQAGQDWLSACFGATLEVFYTHGGLQTPRAAQPLLSAILGSALVCSPALLVTLALVTRNPLQLLLLEVKKSKSEKKYCLLHLHIEGIISLTNTLILFWNKPIFNYSSLFQCLNPLLSVIINPE